MKKSRIAKWLISTLLIILILYPVGIVMAVPPVTTTDEFVWDAEWVGECDGFTILAYGEHKYTEKLYFDQDGELTKIQVHYSIVNGKVYNSEDQSIYLPEGPDYFMFVVDPDSGNLTQSGLALHVKVPGYGVIAINAGRIILDPYWNILWEAGQNDFFTGELDMLCDYLSTP